MHLFAVFTVLPSLLLTVLIPLPLDSLTDLTDEWKLEVSSEDDASEDNLPTQHLSIDNYLADITAPTSFNTTCFMVTTADVTTVGELKAVLATMETNANEGELFTAVESWRTIRTHQPVLF